MSVVAVTGGSGFVGGHVIAALRGAGHHVIDVGRRPGHGHPHEHARVDLAAADGRVPDLGDVPLVHCAAEVRDGFDTGMLRRNDAITRSALALTTGRIVHISSSSVYDLAGPSIGVRPEAATGRYRWHSTYSESKFRAEQQVVDARRDGAVVLRPHAVYGVRDRALVPQVVHAARRGALALPGGGVAVHALTAVENLTAAVVAALRVDLAGTHVLNVTDDEPVPLRDAFHAALGRRVPIVPVPVRPAARVAALCRGRFGISPYTVLQLGYERTYDVERTRELLGWEPQRGTLARLRALRTADAPAR